jgi:hypothetical protein
MLPLCGTTSAGNPRETIVKPVSRWKSGSPKFTEHSADMVRDRARAHLVFRPSELFEGPLYDVTCPLPARRILTIRIAKFFNLFSKWVLKCIPVYFWWSSARVGTCKVLSFDYVLSWLETRW